MVCEYCHIRLHTFMLFFHLTSASQEREDQGHENNAQLAGQFKLAMACLTGDGLDRDYKKAGKWFEKAAPQGHAISQYNLGMAL